MAKIEKFEDLEVWQSARNPVPVIYALCREEGFARDFGLRDQIQRAAVSIMSNIAEGFEHSTNKELIRFFYC
jgi:four helix bundle protein